MDHGATSELPPKLSNNISAQLDFAWFRAFIDLRVFNDELSMDITCHRQDLANIISLLLSCSRVEIYGEVRETERRWKKGVGAAALTRGAQSRAREVADDEVHVGLYARG